MATVIGEAKHIYEQCTCGECAAIIEYVPNELRWNGYKDEDCKIMGLNCPRCGNWIRTNS